MRRIVMLLAAAVIVAGCGNHLAKQQTEARQEPLCGGYTEQREPTEMEMEMFSAVTGTGEMTLTPLSVSTQVVAGTNYKFWCRYQDKDAGGHCWVVIFKPLPGRGEPELTSIQKELQQ